MKKLAIILGLYANIGFSITAEEVVKRSNNQSYYRGKNGRATVSMFIKDARGNKRKRRFTILRMNDDQEGVDGNQKFYVYFHRPADVKGMSYLVWKNMKSDDDRWMYLPGLDLVKRIAAGDKRTSFVGSDFYYEDVSGRNITADEHKLLETNKTYHVIQSTPKDPSSVEFAYYKSWIHTASFIPIKVEYYTKDDKPYRAYEAKKVELLQGVPTVIVSTMKDLQKNSETTIKYSKIKYDTEIPESTFTERYLKKAPLELLKGSAK